MIIDYSVDCGFVFLPTKTKTESFLPAFKKLKLFMYVLGFHQGLGGPQADASESKN